jgi:hypothetical protein
MNLSLRIFLLSFWAVFAGVWPQDAGAQAVAVSPCAFPLAGNILGVSPGGAAARAAMIKRTVRCLQATGQWPATSAPATAESFVTIDPPGSTSTTPSAITPDRTIVGLYSDAAGVQHGFLRDRNGGFTTFDPPGSASTTPTSVTPNGEIAGAYCDTAACPRTHGFVRGRDGAFTTFDSPGASGSIENSMYGYSGSPPPSINPAGVVAGTYFDASGEHGFLRTKNGALTTIDAPGSQGNTEVLAINPSGVVVGDSFCCAGFVRFPNGSFTTFESADICPGESIPTGGVNPAGVVAGSTEDPSCTVALGFLWTLEGRLTTFGVPGAINTGAEAINPAGSITGPFFFTLGSGIHGFVRTPAGTITQFDAPGSSITWPTGINPAGEIIGFYYDANGVQHGFLRSP